MIGHSNDHFQSLGFNGVPPWKEILMGINNLPKFSGVFKLNSNICQTNNIHLKSLNKSYKLDSIMSRLATPNENNSEALKEFASKCDVAIHATAE